MPNNQIPVRREYVNRKLAAYFLSLNPGDNIKSVRELASGCSASIGLISESISHLEKIGVIKIERRGQLGSCLLEYSPGGLWNAAHGEPLVIAHTLPSTPRYEGLATALKQIFNQNGVEVYFIFIRGSRTRLQALQEKRCHIALMSQFAAEGLCSRKEKNALTLPAGSFVKSHQVFFRQDTLEDNQTNRVAVDPDSYDQFRLSSIEFKDEGVEFKKLSFLNIRRYLLENKVDIALWTEEDMKNWTGGAIQSRPLSLKTRRIIEQNDTRASLIVRKEDTATARLIETTLEEKKIAEIQQSVISGKIIPEY